MRGLRRAAITCSMDTGTPHDIKQTIEPTDRRFLSQADAIDRTKLRSAPVPLPRRFRRGSAARQMFYRNPTQRASDRHERTRPVGFFPQPPAGTKRNRLCRQPHDGTRGSRFRWNDGRRRMEPTGDGFAASDPPRRGAAEVIAAARPPRADRPTAPSPGPGPQTARPARW